MMSSRHGGEIKAIGNQAARAAFSSLTRLARDASPANPERETCRYRHAAVNQRTTTEKGM